MFAQLAQEIPRDRWGRPLITPVDGGKPIPYTRVSTLAKALDDKTALTDWKCRQIAIGLAARPDLVTKTKACGDDKRALKEVVQEALSAAQSDRAANVGTALHAFTEKIDAGAAPENLVTMTDPLFLDLVAYREATKHLGMEATDTGLLIHLPSEAGRCDLYLIDLTHGWDLAQAAVAVRAAYKTKPLTPYNPATATAAVPA